MAPSWIFSTAALTPFSREELVRACTPEKELDKLKYVDPPYVHAARGDSAAYSYEMTDKDHESLAKVLNRVRGRVVLSGYRTDLYVYLCLPPWSNCERMA